MRTAARSSFVIKGSPQKRQKGDGIVLLFDSGAGKALEKVPYTVVCTHTQTERDLRKRKFYTNRSSRRLFAA